MRGRSVAAKHYMEESIFPGIASEGCHISAHDVATSSGVVLIPCTLKAACAPASPKPSYSIPRLQVDKAYRTFTLLCAKHIDHSRY